MKIETVKALWKCYKDDYVTVKYGIENSGYTIHTVYKFLQIGMNKGLIESKNNPLYKNGKVYKIIVNFEFPRFYIEFEKDENE